MVTISTTDFSTADSSSEESFKVVELVVVVVVVVTAVGGVDGDLTPTDEITEIGLTQSFFCAQYNSFSDFSSSMRALF